MEDKNRAIKFHEFFNVEIDADYKVPTRETGDTLALLSGKEELVKVYDKNDEFRLIINQAAIKKVLIFRG